MPKALRLSNFSGMVPRLGRRLLAEPQAQVATNARLTSGELAPLKETALVDTPGVTGVQSIYKLVQAGVDYWLAWDADVNAAKGPIAGDTTNRLYYTGVGEPRVTNFTLATASTPYPYSWYVLGVTPPVTAPGLSHGSGSGTSISRAFVYTFVTQWGEESQPSPASSVVVGKTDGTWTLTGMDTVPPNSYTTSAASWSGGTLTVTVNTTFGLRAGENVTLSGLAPAALNASWEVASVASTTSFTITMSDPGTITDPVGTATRDAPHNTTGMTKNIYWSQTDSAGTSYQLVKSNVAVADTSTTVAGDTTPEEEIASTDWRMPPVDLHGIMFHPSGAAVGFTGNQVCFSEPYSPYAWPLEYRFTLDHDVVGVGLVGTTVVAGTEGNPYVLTGVDPASMAVSKLDQPWPCLAKRGLVSSGQGVMYPTTMGLALVSPSGSGLMTKDLYTRIEWTALSPESFRAAVHGDRYVVSYSPAGSTRQILILDRTEPASVTTANKVLDVLYGDPRTGSLYGVLDDDIVEWDSDSATAMLYDWMSKDILLPEVFNPGAAKIDALFSLTPEEAAALSAAAAALQAANEAEIAADSYDIEGSMGAVGEIETAGVSFGPVVTSASESLQFQLWVDNELKYSTRVFSDRMFRLPSGYKANSLAVRITGDVRVLSVAVAETADGLRAV